MLLAGDVGGTNTRLGLFERGGQRPRAVASDVFSTLDHEDLVAIIRAFTTKQPLAHLRIEAACFGVAGPVADGSAQLTNVGWRVDTEQVSKAFGIRPVSLLNDLQAMAWAVPVLEDSELLVLRSGTPREGNMALVAAGTGLGEAILHHVADQFIPGVGRRACRLCRHHRA
jgi:glucokinase